MQIDRVILAATAIVIQNKKVLLLKRSRNEKSYTGYWQPPEGHIETNENPEKTVLREIREELGTTTKKIKFIGTSSYLYDINESNILGIRILFKANVTGKIKLSVEHSKYKWFTKNDLQKSNKIVPGTSKILLKYL